VFIGGKYYCAGEGQQTSPLVREGVRHQQTRNSLAVIKIWSWVPNGCLTPRETGRLTVDRNINLTSRVAVAEAGGQLGRPEEGERPPLEAVTRRLVKAKCVL
jgi:hypothetical protein